VLDDYGTLIFISIHAPAWGATFGDATCWFTFDISIHAPAWGATYIQTREYDNNGHFNPRSRVGSDLFLCSNTVYLRISIHAPAWGATRFILVCVLPLDDFNPRSRVGSD